ncbi:MAG: site-specific DNA-methyltransferase [Methanobacteriota archaeon]|nr:MAG: site-specific DNA-methyltransferase [Euryarchaeota archaeon]
MCSRGSRETRHLIVIGNSQNMREVESRSVDLVVTSPPYPMIEMWDELFGKLDPDVAEALAREDGTKAFDLMHVQLEKSWGEVVRTLRDGGIACINIGDATRTIGNRFQMYSNHSRVTDWFERAGVTSLPSIVWRKPTNAPNKFMGSGMLPPGAYVTLEHEHILVFRKGSRRSFDTPEERRLRSESSYFWEERNRWFSDIWSDLLGTDQSLNGNSGRQRSGAFPFEVPYRLINMFSVKGDLVLDPFLGTGTTTLAAAASQRDSLGYEIDKTLAAVVRDRLKGFRETANSYIAARISRHREFAEGRKCGSVNEHHGFPCVSNQETAIRLELLDAVDIEDGGGVTVRYGGLAR